MWVAQRCCGNAEHKKWWVVLDVYPKTLDSVFEDRATARAKAAALNEGAKPDVPITRQYGKTRGY